MTLRLGVVIEQIDDLDPETTIYGPTDRPLSPDSPVYVAVEGSPIPPGLVYLLEVSLARDAIETWSTWRSGRTPSVAEAVAAVVWYADHDAYLDA